jgi:hypothetical protein
MSRLSKSLLALACAGAAVGGTAAVGAQRLDAAEIALACTASGTADVAPAGTGFAWTVRGIGSCLDVALPLADAQIVSFTGTGTSDTLGLCSGLVVSNLSIAVQMTLLDPVTNTTRSFNEVWSLPVTTYPIATPFLISGAKSGAGTILSHILATCPPKGTDSANYAWAQTG